MPCTLNATSSAALLCTDARQVNQDYWRVLAPVAGQPTGGSRQLGFRELLYFELISSRSVGSEAPGAELIERFGSHSAVIQGSSNLMGVRDPVVDALAGKVAAARTRVRSLPASGRVMATSMT